MRKKKNTYVFTMNNGKTFRTIKIKADTEEEAQSSLKKKNTRLKVVKMHVINHVGE